ncbi:MAG TPA: endonuclease III [Candidatus Methylacidiphilales bacterium]|nr:endonuclease III [Candidatus Methylacidiphilales bacterium]
MTASSSSSPSPSPSSGKKVLRKAANKPKSATGAKSAGAKTKVAIPASSASAKNPVAPLPERIPALVELLKKTYPDAHCELVHSNPLELLIATMLSAQCTDVQVNIVTKDLFKKYKTPSDYVNVGIEELMEDVKRIGLYRNKAKNIQTCCKLLLDKHNGKVPNTMDDLIELAGVGRKTANVVLGNAFGINVGVVVDTHVARLSQRLGLTTLIDPVKIEQVLMKLFPRHDWTMLSHWLIFHGRRRCKAQRPDCPGCELKAVCPSYPITKF